MTNREIRNRIKIFQKEHGLNRVEYGTLRKAVEEEGYTVIEYNHIINDPNVQSLIDSLKLSENTIRSKGFTYADRNFRLVFIHEDLSESEKLFVLAHETGHICLGHLSSGPVIGKDVKEEYEANEFSHFLLHPSGVKKILNTVNGHKKIVIAVSLSALLIFAGVLTAICLGNKKMYYGTYYLTETGSKYHEKNCIFVKDKENVRRLTTEEFESGEYEPCQICLP